MTTFKAYGKKIDKKVNKLLEDGVSIVEEIERVSDELLPYGPSKLSEVESSFEKEMAESRFSAPNSLLEKAIPKTRELLATSIEDITLFQRFVTTHVPSMEDGNNFGVSVQMVVSKVLKEIKEGQTKKLESLATYYSTRADAVDKLNLTKVAESSTVSESTSSSTGGKDGDEAKTSKTASSEKKTSGNPKPTDMARVKHIVALDIQWYLELRNILAAVAAGYINIFDNIEKNKDKITYPKGKGGRGINMAMY